MTDGTKALIGTVAALIALVLMVSIMARCSVDTAKVDASVEECAKSGGTVNRIHGPGPDIVECVKPGLSK